MPDLNDERLSDAIDALAKEIPFGELHAASDPARLLYRAAAIIRSLRREAEHSRSVSCENTPWPGCECPGCSTARELAKEGR